MFQRVMSENREDITAILPADYDQWAYYAACAELGYERQGDEAIVDDFYPPIRLTQAGESTETEAEKRVREQRVKLVCGRCIVQYQCQKYALESEWRGTREDDKVVNDGVWGGMNKKERKASVHYRKAS